jgi:thiol-disulfide isomerase/thioredoxin
MTWTRFFSLPFALSLASIAVAAPHTMTSPPRIDAIQSSFPHGAPPGKSTAVAASAPAASAPAPAPTPAPPTSATPAKPTAPLAPATPGAIQIGMSVPAFSLTVLNNDVAAIKRWGPATDVGDGAAPKKKLLVMSFFATYCEPCKREMPELARLFAAYKDQGLAVAMVSIDKGDEQKNAILELAKTSKVGFPIVHDRFNVVARRYEADRLPYMILVDSTGKIVAAHVGYTDEVRTGLEAELRGYLGLPKA